MKCLIDKYCSSKDGRMFACFVDFQKAFDSVIYAGIKIKLMDIGVGSLFYNIIKAMYSTSHSCIKIAKNTFSEFFPLSLGVKQGDSLSPNLFKIFLNDLPQVLDLTSDPVTLKDRSLHCLLYADDLVLLSTTEKGLQEKLHVLDQYCKKWCLDINAEKNKIIISTKLAGKFRRNFALMMMTLNVSTLTNILVYTLVPQVLFHWHKESCTIKHLKVILNTAKISYLTVHQF